MKNYLLIIILLFSIISCEEDDIDITDSFRSENGLTFNESLDIWNELKLKNGDSYSYEIKKGSWTGQGDKTTIKVEDNIVVARNYIYGYYEYVDNELELIVEYSYQEDKTNLGSNERGAEIKIIEDYYLDCSSKYLTVNQKTNKLIFSTNEKGMMTACGYTPEDCVDDCNFGISISNFEWTKQ